MTPKTLLLRSLGRVSILSGGETDYLPEGTVGFFGEEGTRTDGRNLIEEAEEMG